MLAALDFSDPQPRFGSIGLEAIQSCQASGLTIVGDIVLHNRSDIIEKLGSEFEVFRKGCDAELVLAAYLKWGSQCPDFFAGEFAFAIWNKHQKSLFCCRDHMGARPFFYFQDHSSFTFADDIRAILSSPRVPRRLNIPKLAATAFAGGLLSFPENTYHAGVNVLLPGSWMLLDPGGQRKQTYWKPEIRDDRIPAREDEIFDALRDLLKQAVECRLERCARPAALLSGGLDSSAVVSLAARRLAAQNNSLPALGVVVSDEWRDHIPDERKFIDEFRGKPGVDVHYVRAQGLGPFDSIDDPHRFEAGLWGTSRLYLYEALERAALDLGADLLFEGDGGELGPTNWGGGWYAELALSGRWLTLLNETRAARFEGTWTPWRQLARELRNCALPAREHKPPLLLRDEFVRSSGVAPSIKCEMYRWPNQRRHQQRRVQEWLMRSATRGYSGLPSRLRRVYPLRDKRLIEFCISVPGRYKIRNGYRRYLIRRGLDGILPPRIQWRTTKSPFSPDYYMRYNAQLVKARHFVASIGLRDPIRSVVDIEAVNRLLQRPPVSDGDYAALAVVPSTVYLICFLRQFADFRA